MYANSKDDRMYVNKINYCKQFCYTVYKFMILFNVVGKEMNDFDTLHFQCYSVLAATFSTHTLFFLLFLP